MLAQAVVIQDNKVLMVRQHVQRGAIVWNFPGGGIEAGETAEEACIREVKEETGYDIRVLAKMHVQEQKHTYQAEIIGGTQGTDRSIKSNEAMMEEGIHESFVLLQLAGSRRVV